MSSTLLQLVKGKEPVANIIADSMRVNIEKKTSTLEAKHDNKDMKTWNFTSYEFVIINLKNLVSFDFELYSNIKVNAMMRKITTFMVFYLVKMLNLTFKG